MAAPEPEDLEDEFLEQMEELTIMKQHGVTGTSTDHMKTMLKDTDKLTQLLQSVSINEDVEYSRGKQSHTDMFIWTLTSLMMDYTDMEAKDDPTILNTLPVIKHMPIHETEEWKSQTQLLINLCLEDKSLSRKRPKIMFPRPPYTKYNNCMTTGAIPNFMHRKLKE